MNDAKRVARGRRQQREAFSRFDSLIESPFDLGGGDLEMPASARLAMSHSAALTLGQVRIDIVPGRVSFSHAASAADLIHLGSWADAGTRISQSNAPTGTLRIYIVSPLDGTFHVVAQQVIA